MSGGWQMDIAALWERRGGGLGSDGDGYACGCGNGDEGGGGETSDKITLLEQGFDRLGVEMVRDGVVMSIKG